PRVSWRKPGRRSASRAEVKVAWRGRPLGGFYPSRTGMGTSACDDLREEVTPCEIRERLNHLRVELAAGVAADLVDGVIDGEGGLIGPHGGHGVEGVGDQDDAAQDRDFLPGETERVAVTVVPFVVVEDGLGDLGVDAVAGHGESE